MGLSALLSSQILDAGNPNCVATLDALGKLTASQIPDIALINYLGSVASQAAMLTLVGQQGDWCVRSDLGTTWVITGSNPTQLSSWTQLSYPTAPVQSVFGRTGNVVGVSTDYSSVGLTNTAIAATNLSASGTVQLTSIASGTTESMLVLLDNSGNLVKRPFSALGVSNEESIVNALIFG